MSRRPAPDQLELFPGAAPGRVAACAAPPELEELARRLPPEVHLGGSTWSFPGWAGLVYDRAYPESRLAREGLAAYAAHPLLNAVGLDRTFYAPLRARELAAYARAVPPGFRFVVKAHEDCTLERFPDRPRYGDRRGLANPRFLDPAYATREVVEPYLEGLGEKAGALVFQFPPQDLGGAERFAARLAAFLRALPPEATYATEIRTRGLLGRAYAEALESARACHCLNVHPTMPELPAQAALAGVDEAPALVLRWIVRPGLTYEAATRRFTPFERLVDPDPGTRRAVAALVRRAAARGVAALITVNNLAEGSAPRSIELLARKVVEPEA